MSRRFILHSPLRSLDAFRLLAEHACRLKPYGEVAINISTLAEKNGYDVPEGGSPWHQRHLTEVRCL